MARCLLLLALSVGLSWATPIDGVSLADPPLWVSAPAPVWRDLGNGLIWEGPAMNQLDFDLLVALTPESEFPFAAAVSEPSPVPEPATAWLAGMALAAGLVWVKLGRQVRLRRAA